MGRRAVSRRDRFPPGRVDAFVVVDLVLWLLTFVVSTVLLLMMPLWADPPLPAAMIVCTRHFV